MATFEELLATYGIGAITGTIIIVSLLLALITYILTSLALMKIAQKTKTQYPWLAWIPIANVFLMAFVAEKEWWYALIIVLSPIIPIIGWLVFAALSVYLWWIISEKLNTPGALSLLILIPVVNIAYMLYLAFK